MPSIFYMERNGQKYAYESRSIRVPGRKNPKTIKTYLGKVDPETGKIVPKKSRDRPKEEYAKPTGRFRSWTRYRRRRDCSRTSTRCSQTSHPTSWVRLWPYA